MKKDINKVNMPKQLVEDLMLMAEKWYNKTPATETVVFDSKTKKVERTVNYRKTIEDAVRALRSSNVAHWVGVKYDSACCSKCGAYISTDFDTTSQAKEEWGNLYPYCPHCGAQMDLTVPFEGKSRNKKTK